MPDQWGRPQFSDYMDIVGGISSISNMQDKTRESQYQDDVETGMGAIRNAGDIPLNDVQKPDNISDRAWATSKSAVYNLKNMDNQAKQQRYQLWKQDVTKSKAQAAEDLQKLFLMKNRGVDDQTMKKNILAYYDKNVKDMGKFDRIENRDGKNVYVFKDVRDNSEFTLPDMPVDKALESLKRYVSSQYDNMALANKMMRWEYNTKGMTTNAIDLQGPNGEMVTIFPALTPGTNEQIFTMRDPESDDLKMTSLDEWVSKGFRQVKRLTPDEAAKTGGAQDKRIMEHMKFILKQLGIRDVDSGDNLGLSDKSSTSVGRVMEIAKNGSEYEKGLAQTYLNYANQLYPGLSQQQEQVNPFKLDPGTINEMKGTGNNTLPMRAPAPMDQPYTSEDVRSLSPGFDISLDKYYGEDSPSNYIPAEEPPKGNMPGLDSSISPYYQYDPYPNQGQLQVGTPGALSLNRY